MSCGQITVYDHALTRPGRCAATSAKRDPGDRDIAENSQYIFIRGELSQERRRHPDADPKNQPPPQLQGFNQPER